MFTGIVLDTGRVIQRASIADHLRLSIQTSRLSVSTIKPGDSIAVNGVCLTVTQTTSTNTLSFDVSAETLAKTSLSGLQENSRVNLETALTLQTLLGGHLISGHVDATGELTERRKLGEYEQFWIRIPPHLNKYIAVKGSICVDGVSLTVNEAAKDCFSVTIVPHTLQQTIFSDYPLGQRVNIEVDIIARYLEQLLQNR